MYLLPIEIIRLIYLYDNTYHKQYQLVIKEMNFKMLYDFYHKTLHFNEDEYTFIVKDVLLKKHYYPNSFEMKQISLSMINVKNVQPNYKILNHKILDQNLKEFKILLIKIFYIFLTIFCNIFCINRNKSIY